MKLILLENVYNLGDLGDTVNVKPGFGRNYLLPRGKAIPATPANLEKFEQRREELQRQADEKKAQAQTRAEAVDAIGQIEFKVAVSPEGRLYGSINPHEVAEKLNELGVVVEKAEVDMPEGPIRTPGQYQANLILHADVQTTIALSVIDSDDTVAAQANAAEDAAEEQPEEASD